MKKVFILISLYFYVICLSSISVVSSNNQAVKAMNDSLIYKAETSLKEGLKKDPYNPMLNYNMGVLRLKQYEDNHDKSNLEKAIKNFEIAKSDKDKSNKQSALYNLGNVHYFLEDYTKAINSYQNSATILDSTNVDSELMYNYANSIYKYAESNSQADSLYAYAQEIYKATYPLTDKDGKQNILHNLGNTAFMQGNYQEALDYYVQALKNNPFCSDTRTNYEITLQKMTDNQSQQDQKQEEEEEQDNGQDQSQEQQEQSEQQQNEMKEKQEKYDELSEEEKEKLEAEKRLDALLQQQEQSDEDKEKTKYRNKRPTGRYW